MKEDISLEQAQQILLERVRHRRETYVSLWEAAGRILSQDIIAGNNQPAFPSSRVDGYALRAEDIRDASHSNPVGLRVLEATRAGYAARHTVSRGTAIKVMTGAPVPQGADAIMKYEDLQQGTDVIEVYHPLRPGKNILLAGRDIRINETIARRGQKITPSVLGLIVGTGLSEVPVFEGLTAALISTGDELVNPSANLDPGKIYPSNLYTLHARCQELGVTSLPMGIIKDDKEVIAEYLLEGLRKADIVITTGGVSAGDYDLLKDAMKSIGTEVLFDRIAIRPGSAMVAGRVMDQFVIGLSGNPAAAFIVFDLLTVPLLRKMMGQDQPLPTMIQGRLSHDFAKQGSQRRLVRGILYNHNGVNYIRINDDKTRGVLVSMAECNVLVDLPADIQKVQAGEKVTACKI
ncbi:MAG: gephyrin-like molybdotransferase Glp [Bacillota bacterium]|nr:gephyrin-like molybdotransferase Glp [Bacillota bacterium]